MLQQVRQRYHILPTHNQSVREAKKQGKKVFGYLCHHIPEETVYAAGALPIRLVGSSTDLSRVYNYFPAPTCYFSRSCRELGLQGDYELRDGILTTYTCDTMHGLSDIWEETVSLPYSFFANRPHDAKARGALTFYLQELDAWEKSLEEFLAVKITDNALAQAIRIYNDDRCKPCNVKSYALRNALETELGIPTLVVELDQTDYRGYRDAQIKTRLDAFMEMLEARRSG